MRQVNPRLITMVMIVFTILISGGSILAVTLLDNTESVAPTDSSAALEDPNPQIGTSTSVTPLVTINSSPTEEASPTTTRLPTQSPTTQIAQQTQVTPQMTTLPTCTNQYYDQRFVGSDGKSYFQRCSVGGATGGLVDCSGIKTPIPYTNEEYYANLGELKSENLIVGSSDFVYYDEANTTQTLSQKYIDSNGDVYSRTCPKPPNGFGITGCDGVTFSESENYKNKADIGLPANMKLIGMEESFYYEGTSQRVYQRLISSDNRMFGRFCSNVNCRNADNQEVHFFEIPELAGSLGLPGNYKNVGSSDAVLYANGTQLFYQRLVSEANASYSRTCTDITICNDPATGQPKNFIPDNPSLSDISQGIIFSDPSEFMFCSESVISPILNPQITPEAGVTPTPSSTPGSPPGGGPILTTAPTKTPTVTLVMGIGNGVGNSGPTSGRGKLPDTAVNIFSPIFLILYASTLIAFSFFVILKCSRMNLDLNKNGTFNENKKKNKTLEEVLLDDMALD